MTAPTALLVTTVHWPATTRLALALAKAGFAVAAVAPADHTLARLPNLVRHDTCPRYGHVQRRLSRAVTRAMDALSPAIVIPCDDAAVLCVQSLHANKAPGGRKRADHSAVLRRSLGAPSSFPIVASKGEFIRFAASIGVAMPTTEVARQPAELRRHAIGLLPKVIKIDRTSGGTGVCVVRTAEAWHEVATRLTTQPTWFKVAKRIVRCGNFQPLRQRLAESMPPVLLQEFVAGELANCSLVALDGVVLGCHSARVVHTLGETGPATVSWIGRQRALEEIAARIVRALGFSGFCGFDFVLRKENDEPVVIEMNPRPTQTCHLALGGDSLADALFAGITGAERRVPARDERERLVALFPQEFWRDPKSPYLHDAYCDVPWEAPYLITAYRRPPPGDWVERTRRLLRSDRITQGRAAAPFATLPQTRRGVTYDEHH